MGSGTNPADALNKRPGVAWITPFQNYFQAAPDGATGYRVGDDVVFIDIDLGPHMALDAGDRIDHHALAGCI